MNAKEVLVFWIGVHLSIAGEVGVQPARAEALAQQEVCEQWVQNAVIGYGRALQGAPRKLVPLTENEVSYLLQHGAFFDVPGIVVWAKNYATERDFLEESTFYGYDWADRSQAAGGTADAEVAREAFSSVCMSRTGGQ